MIDATIFSPLPFFSPGVFSHQPIFLPYRDPKHRGRATYGDGEGQDTHFGLGAGDTLVGRSAADQLADGPGPDLLEGNDGNDTLDGGIGEDRIFTRGGFDFVYVRDGDTDYVNCNGQSNYRIVFDEGWTGSTAARGRTPTRGAAPLRPAAGWRCR